MGTLRTLARACGAAAFGLMAAAAANAQDAVMVGKNPTECEVAAALGVNKAGCPPLPHLGAPVKKPGTRGLAIGNIDQMPEPPPPMEPPQRTAAKPAAAPAATMPVPAATPSPPAAMASAPAVRPEPRPQPRHEYTAAFQINFEFASARLTDDARHVLDLVGAAMTAPDGAGSGFRIVGHTDVIGSPATNQRLSDDRANAVKEYLINQHGIVPSRLQAFGRGARDLLNSANPKSPENRRVEITNLGG